MRTWAPIQYREFHDAPRIFLVRSEDGLFLFDSKFNSAKDEYEETYQIFLMPELDDDELAGSWNELSTKAKKTVGRIPVSQVEFDSTRREQVNLDVLTQLTP